MEILINQPVPFKGSKEELLANRVTHSFGDEYCMDCGCKVWHETANYPCGSDVPRETILREV